MHTYADQSSPNCQEIGIKNEALLLMTVIENGTSNFAGTTFVSHMEKAAAEKMRDGNCLTSISFLPK